MTRKIAYEKISPSILGNIIENSYECMTMFQDIDEDYFSITIFVPEDDATSKRLISNFLKRYE